MTRTLRVLLVALLAVLGLLVGSPAVQASPYTSAEVAYLQTLDYYDVPYSTPDAAVSAGYSVCAYLEVNPTDAGVWTMVAAATRAGFTPRQSGVIIGAAARYLDPAVVPVLERWLADNGYNSSQPNADKVPVLR